MSEEVLSTSVDSSPSHDDGNLVRVGAPALLEALAFRRTQLVNARKVAMAKKAKAINMDYKLNLEASANGLVEQIRDLDAQIALLHAGPRNQTFMVPLKEARSWGFGLMRNGRWPKL